MELTDRRLMVAGLLVTLAAGLTVILSYPAHDWDYRCYVNAARLLEMGRNPYSEELGTRHIYPPLIAHVFLLLRRVLPGDDAVYWLYQTVQTGLLAAAYVLLWTLVRRLGIEARTAAMVSAGLLVINFPVLYTLRHDNVNLALLVAVLLAMLFPRSALAGLALAATTQLKLYPALLLVPLWAFGYRKIAAWWAAGMLLPLLSGGVRQDWLVFLKLLPNMPKGEGVLDNSVTSAIERGVDAIGGDPAAHAIVWVARALGLAALLVMAYRLRRTGAQRPQDHRIMLRSCAEWAALPMLLSPIAWPEHFMFTVPLLAVSFAAGERLALVACAALLLIALPRTPIYPLSHHYLAGLILLLGFPPALPPRYASGVPISQR